MCAIKRNKRSRYYTIVFRPFGEQVWIATRERNKRNAEALEQELLYACRNKDFSKLSDEAKIICAEMFFNKGWQLPEPLDDEFLNPAKEPPVSSLTIASAFKTFLEYPEIVNSKSYPRYKQCLAHFIDYFDVKVDIEAIDVPILKQYRIDKLDEGLSPGTVNWQIGTLSKVFQVMIECGLLRFNPCRDMKSLSQRDGERDAYIGNADFLVMVSGVSEWFKPIVQAAYYTGMRRNEIVELQKSDVNFSQRIIKIRAGNAKEYHWKRVPICRELEPILRQSIASSGPDCQWVFSINEHKTNPESYKRQWGNAVKSLELKPRFHDLRATWKVNARNSGIEEEIRRAIMGHGTRTREVRERYGRILDAELVQAIDKMKYDFGPTVILTAK